MLNMTNQEAINAVEILLEHSGQSRSSLTVSQIQRALNGWQQIRRQVEETQDGGQPQESESETD